ncbi:MAG: HAD-IB family hydrolase [Chloroflexi bacterium]|nr:HAD-IB family hydrolase [Chloroflexota bacterium]MBU1749424.1 HAD-IB family hydrolase [Chloroflexota bacterium]
MPQIAALFDMDKTLLNRSTGMMYVGYLREQGRLNRRQMLQILWYGALYKLGLVSFPTLGADLVADLAGGTETQLRDLCEELFRERIIYTITDAGRERIAQHREQGHIPVILSASTNYVVEPLARHLGVTDVLCTRLVVGPDDHFTGQIVEPPCFGPQKVTHAERWAAVHDVDLGASYFYSDSFTDRSMLERVGHPVVVNPDTRLRRLAGQRGWPIEGWE